MKQRQLPVRFTTSEELELYEFLRKESFDTGLAMAEIVRIGLELYKNRKEKGEMRKSLQDIAHMVRDKAYPGTLPQELKPYHYYVVDGGHSIMCVLELHIKEVENIDMDMYEVPVPVKYVLEKGYRFVDGYVVVDAPYDKSWGLDVDEKYTEV